MAEIRDIPAAVWTAGAVALVALAILIHAVFPRYEYQLVTRPDSVSIVVYDRWSGQFQRGVYTDAGELKAFQSWRPF